MLTRVESEPGAGLDAFFAANAVAVVGASAVAFAARHPRQASLTLLLPSARAGGGAWQQAGDAAAARMLVSTLACEWGGQALRINALEVPAQPEPSRLKALLRHVCGPAAQYLTRQTLVCHGAAPAVAA